MKPLGIDRALWVRAPTRAEDAIWEAVRAARSAGWTIDDFEREAIEAWRAETRDDLRVLGARRRQR